MANVNIYKTQGGNELVVGEGATLTIDGTLDASGATFDLGNNSITTAMIQNGAVTKAKTGLFISGTTVGTGNPQVIPHGLGVNPTTANVFFSVISTAAAGNFAFTALATDGTNITVTATNTISYRVIAWAP